MNSRRLTILSPKPDQPCVERSLAQISPALALRHRPLPSYPNAHGACCSAFRAACGPAQDLSKTPDPMTPKSRRCANRCDANHVRDHDLTGHAADMSKSTHFDPYSDIGRARFEPYQSTRLSRYNVVS